MKTFADAVKLYREREAERAALEERLEERKALDEWEAPVNVVLPAKPTSAEFWSSGVDGRVFCAACATLRGVEPDRINATVYALFCNDCGKIIPVS